MVEMKPVFQTTFGDGKGNCLSAALASLLEWDIEDVPNFSEYGGRFWPVFWEWMQEHNLGWMRLEPTPGNVPNGYHLICVKSPRGDFYHELVGFNGEPVHDPYPGGNCQNEGIYKYDLVYPLDLSKPIGNKA